MTSISISKDLAARTEYTAGTGHFNNMLSRLRTLGLIERGGGQVRASDMLFPERE